MSPARVIAIVDDDASLRRSLGSLLRSAGFLIETFTSAEELIGGGKFEALDAAVVDIRMPGMSGLDLLAELSRRAIQLPVVVLTAHGDEDVRNRCIRRGAVAFLNKPVQANDLIDALHRATERPRAPV